MVQRLDVRRNVERLRLAKSRPLSWHRTENRPTALNTPPRIPVANGRGKEVDEALCHLRLAVTSEPAKATAARVRRAAEEVWREARRGENCLRGRSQVKIEGKKFLPVTQVKQE
jgi:hypothetical protein